MEVEKAPKEINIQRSPEVTYGIRNFVGNAVKFSKKNVNINLVGNGQTTTLQISDDGPGFPDDIYKIIGEPYISTKSKKLRSKAGLGLGTFIGKTLLEKNFATVKFSNSEFTGGAEVTIEWKDKDLKKI